MTEGQHGALLHHLRSVADEWSAIAQTIAWLDEDRGEDLRRNLYRFPASIRSMGFAALNGCGMDLDAVAEERQRLIDEAAEDDDAAHDHIDRLRFQVVAWPLIEEWARSPDAAVPVFESPMARTLAIVIAVLAVARLALGVA